MRNKQMTERMVAEMVLEEFKKNNNFSFNIPQQVIEETKKEEKMYEPSRISVSVCHYWHCRISILDTSKNC